MSQSYISSDKYLKVKKYTLKIQEGNAGREKPRYCEVCGNDGKICYDHDHKTGNFRGWICGGCNRALGMVRDNPKTLRLLADYLESSKK